MAVIEENFNTTVIKDLKEMKFILPDTAEKEIVKQLDDLAEKIENEFRKLLHNWAYEIKYFKQSVDKIIIICSQKFYNFKFKLL